MSADVERLVSTAVAMNLAQQSGDELGHARLSHRYLTDFTAAGRITKIRAHFRIMRWLRAQGIRHA